MDADEESVWALLTDRSKGRKIDWEDLKPVEIITPREEEKEPIVSSDAKAPSMGGSSLKHIDACADFNLESETELSQP